MKHVLVVRTKQVVEFQLIRANIVCYKHGKASTWRYGTRTALDNTKEFGTALASLDADERYKFLREIESRILTAVCENDLDRAISLTCLAYGPVCNSADVRAAFTVESKMLRGINPKAMIYIRRSAALLMLGWNSQAEIAIPRGLETGAKVDARVAAQMICSYIESRHWVEYAVRCPDSIKGIRVVNSEGSPCSACREIAENMWTVGEQPEIPYEHCENVNGCRCSYITIRLGT